MAATAAASAVTTPAVLVAIDIACQACYRFLTMRLALAVLLATMLPVVSPAFAQDDGRQSVSFESLELSAEEISLRPFTTREFEAVGDVYAVYDDSELFADRLSGNAETLEIFADRARVRIGQKRIQGQEIFTRRLPIAAPPGYSLEYVIREGLFTTCDLVRPDYRVTASEITLRPDDYVSARRVSIWLGRTRILTVPALRIGIDPDRQRETFFPRPGYSADDGAFLAFSNSLIAGERADVRLRVRATTRRGLQGGVLLERTLRGPLAFNTARALELEERPLLAPMFEGEDASCPVFVQSRAFPSQLIAYGRLLRRERTFDPDVRDLRLDASPEIGVRWISTPFRLTNSVSAYAAAQTSWGRFDEVFGDNTASGTRADVRATLTAFPISLPGGFFIQPAVAYRLSDYEGRESYRTIGASADVTRVIGRSYISARYLTYGIRGSTPFEFDDVDRSRELQTSVQYCGNVQGVGLLLRYAFDQGGLYDWEFSYSRRFHCLEPTFTWRNRFRMFSVDLRVLGFN